MFYSRSGIHQQKGRSENKGFTMMLSESGSISQPIRAKEKGRSENKGVMVRFSFSEFPAS